MPAILEIACFTLESCMLAQKAKADRIEFCLDYASGGFTPSHEEISKARQLISIPLYVMIRTQSKNYIYNQEEINTMKQNIMFCKLNKIDGIVFGVLNENYTINEAICEELLELAKPMKCTFHRAIDSCPDLNKSIELLIKLGFDTVLTSGGSANAYEGLKVLKELQKKYGSKITIMPGGGIRPNNITVIKNETQCTAFHSAAINLNSKSMDVNMITELLHAIKS